LFGTLLPVSLYEENWVGMRTVPVRLTEQQALEQAKEKLSDYEEKLSKDTKILAVSTSHRIENDTFIYSVTLKCEENIAEKSEILIK
jgi:similar to stage IV sporulation protein